MKLLKKPESTLGLVLVLFGLLGCATPRPNPNHKAAKEPGIYPKFTQRDSLRGGLNKFRTCFDVSHYELDIDIDPAKQSVEGSVVVSFDVVTATRKIQLDLYENMTLVSVEFEGKPLKTSRKFDAFYVEFPRVLLPNEKHFVTVAYYGVPMATKKPWKSNGIVWGKYQDKPQVRVSCQRAGASLWWPLKDHLSDKPDSARMNFTVPKGLKCISNGKLRNRSIDGDRETFHWAVTRPVNISDITFYIGDFRSFRLKKETTEGPLEMDFFCSEKNLEKAQEHMNQAGKMIDFMEAIYGEYPGKKDGFKLVEITNRSKFHQASMTVDHEYKNIYKDIDFAMLHAIAHEWWGGSVSVGDLSDIWIEEALASYTELLYLEHVYGYDFDELRNDLFWYRTRVQNKTPLVGPSGVRHWGLDETDPFTKGVMLLHSLRYAVDDDDLFMGILKSFYQKHRMSTVTSTDFIEHVEMETSEKYKWFFYQFLYRRKPPKLMYRVTGDRNDATMAFEYHWVDCYEHFTMPIPIIAAGKTYRIYPTTKTQSIPMISDKYVLFENSQSYYTLGKTKDWKPIK